MNKPTILTPEAVHGYLCFSYVPTLTIQEAAWQENLPFLTDQDQAVTELRELLQEATVRQLGGASEVGVFLSGGLDSSLVAALLCDLGVRVHLFTLDFGEPYNAELVHAQTVAAHLKRPLYLVPAKVKDIAKALHPTAQAMQQPFGDAVCVPLYLLGLAASQYTGTIFNGEFGDQLFGGWANKPMIAAELYGAADYNREAAYMATYHKFYGLTDVLYTPKMRQSIAHIEAANWVCPALNKGEFSSLLHRLRAANLRLKGAQNIAPRCRQLAQACGLQVRSPFFDRALTEWTFRCPPEWFLQGAQEKFLLKRVAETYLPSDIVWREKRGMGVPATQWCTGGMRREIARTLHPRRIRRDGMFQTETIKALCRSDVHPGEIRSRRLGERLWALFMLHVWQDVHSISG